MSISIINHHLVQRNPIFTFFIDQELDGITAATFNVNKELNTQVLISAVLSALPVAVAAGLAIDDFVLLRVRDVIDSNGGSGGGGGGGRGGGEDGGVASLRHSAISTPVSRRGKERLVPATAVRSSLAAPLDSSEGGGQTSSVRVAYTITTPSSSDVALSFYALRKELTTSIRHSKSAAGGADNSFTAYLRDAANRLGALDLVYVTASSDSIKFEDQTAPPPSHHSSRYTAGAVAGIVVGCAIGCIGVAAVLHVLIFRK